MKILVKVYPASGHIHASLALAAGLVRLGHEVAYSGPRSLADHLRRQDFSFFEQPRDCAYSPDVAPRRLRRNAVGQFVHGVKQRLRRQPPGAYLLEAVFLQNVRTAHADVLLLDDYFARLAPLIRREGIPFAIFSTLASCERTPGLPPPCSGLIPDGSAAGAVLAHLAWTRYLLVQRALGLVGIGPLSGPRAACLEGRRFQNPAMAEVPEIILTPREFDFPRALKAHQLHAGPCVSLDRREVAMSECNSKVARLIATGRDARPLVYCCLGGSPWQYPGAARFFRRLVLASEGAPWNLLIATGRGFRRQLLGAIPENVLLAEQAPQIAVLRRSAVFITHGGMNSISEALLCGVPMLAVPGARDLDQPGNAARIVYHGLGLRARMTKAEPEELRCSISCLAMDPRFRFSVRRMRESIERSEPHRRGPEIVERLLQQVVARAPQRLISQ